MHDDSEIETLASRKSNFIKRTFSVKPRHIHLIVESSDSNWQARVKLQWHIVESHCKGPRTLSN